MYKILLDGKVFCDSRIDDLCAIDPVVKKKANTIDEFTFSIPKEHRKSSESIVRRKSIIEVTRDSEMVFRGVVVTVDEDFYLTKTYTCESELTYLNDSILRPAKYSGVTVLQLLTSYIHNHNAQVDEYKQFQIGNVTVTDSNNYISCYTNMNSTMTEIKEDLIDDLGGYLYVRRVNGINYIDYLKESTHDASQPIELGKNLIDYTSNIDSTDIATRIIPVGAELETSTVEGLKDRVSIKSVNNNIDYLESEAVSTYGIITKVVQWNKVTTPQALKAKGEAYLSDIQFENVIIEATALDFGYLSSTIDKFKMLDRVRIVSEPHGMDRYFVLTEMTINLNNPENDSFKFGIEQKFSLSAKTNNVSSTVLKAVENITPVNTILEQANNQASALIKAGQTGYVTIVCDDNGNPTEICISDNKKLEDAQKVWRWNNGGLGYSSNGYNGTYSLAMTMDGSIVADKVNTGTMYADRIKGGTLKLGGNNNINGLIEMYDSYGRKLAYWDNTGFQLTTYGTFQASSNSGNININSLGIDIYYNFENQKKHIFQLDNNILKKASYSNENNFCAMDSNSFYVKDNGETSAEIGSTKTLLNKNFYLKGAGDVSYLSYGNVASWVYDSNIGKYVLAIDSVIGRYYQ